MDIQQLIKDYKITTFEEYFDFYLNIDVFCWCIWDLFCKTSIETYKLDPCHYAGTPSFGWDAMLLRKNDFKKDYFKLMNHTVLGKQWIM